jgi:hypothetical protein
MSYQTLYSMPCRLACNRYTSVDSVFEAQGSVEDVSQLTSAKPTKAPKRKERMEYEPEIVSESMGYEPEIVSESMGYEPEIVSEGYNKNVLMGRPSPESIICKRCFMNHPPYRIANSCDYNKSYSWDQQILYKNYPATVLVTPKPCSECYENIEMYPQQTMQPLPVQPAQPVQQPMMMQPTQQPMMMQPQQPMQKQQAESCGCELNDVDRIYVPIENKEYNKSSTWVNQQDFRNNLLYKY